MTKKSKVRTAHETYLLMNGLKSKIEKSNLSTAEFRELFVRLFSKRKSFSTLDDVEMAMRFFECAKKFYRFVRVKCAICDKETEIGSSDYVRGIVIDGYKIRWICDDCLDEIAGELTSKGIVMAIE